MKKKNNKKKIIIIVALFAIVALVVVQMNKKESGITVAISKPARKTIIETIPANGKIQPVTEVKISPDVSGEITELYFEEGDTVKKGDLIIKIKPDVYISSRDRAKASLNSIKAQYQQQKAQLHQTELTHKRNILLFEQKVISDTEFENSTTQYNVAKEQLLAAQYNIESAEAALEEAEKNLVKTNIYAPMDGVISIMAVEKGERVVGTSQMAGTEMFRVADFEKMEVLVDVNENDIIRIAQNDKVEIEIDAYPDRKFTGFVTHVANSAKNIGANLDQVTNFEVKVLIDPISYSDLISSNELPFRPGMSASVAIETQRKENILTIPLQSITTRNLSNKREGDQIKQQVFIYNPTTNRVSVMEIKTGIQDMLDIEVTEGLTDSLQVVTAPYGAISNSLKDSSLVNINVNIQD